MGGLPPPNPLFLNIYVKFALYRIISLQTFNVVVKPNKFYCFYITQQATSEKMADFYENFKAFDHFQTHFHFFDQPTINFYDRIDARIV